jgi:hypothetical protein
VPVFPATADHRTSLGSECLTQHGMRSGYSFKNLSTDLPFGGYAARAASVTLVSQTEYPEPVEGQGGRFDKLRVISVEAHMSTTVAPTDSYTIHWLIESRPPSVSWSRSSPPQLNEPPLDLADHESDVAVAAARTTEASGLAV